MFLNINLGLFSSSSSCLRYFHFHDSKYSKIQAEFWSVYSSQIIINAQFLGFGNVLKLGIANHIGRFSNILSFCFSSCFLALIISGVNQFFLLYSSSCFLNNSC
jgi:hypothetical protein